MTAEQKLIYDLCKTLKDIRKGADHDELYCDYSEVHQETAGYIWGDATSIAIEQAVAYLKK